MRQIGVWDLPGHSGPVYALACDHERKVLFSAGGDGYIAEWRCLSGKHARAIARTPHAIYALHLVSDHQHLYVGESSGIVYVLDLSKSRLRRSVKAHQSSIFGLSSHPKDPEGWSSGRDGQFVYWDLNSSAPFASIPVTPRGLRGFVLSPHKESFFCAGRDGYVYEIPRATREVGRRIQADTEFVFTIQVAPQDGHLATGGKSGFLKVWSTELELIWERSAHTYTLNAIAWHPSSLYLATGGRDRLIHIWDARTGEKKLTLAGHQRSVNALLWVSPSMLASAGDDGLVKIWHLEGLPEK